MKCLLWSSCLSWKWLCCGCETVVLHCSQRTNSKVIAFEENIYDVVASAMSGAGHRKLRLCSTNYYERRNRPVSLTVAIPCTVLRSDTLKDLQDLNMKLKSSESLLVDLLQDVVLTKHILFMYISWEVLCNSDKLSIYQVLILGH